jgi:hypothetical protein
MKWIKKGDVAKFVQTVKSRMGKQSAPAAHTADQPDLATQIRQLAGLRDEGLLTDEEFQAKKTQLLG